ncbi:sensor histidine kinase [Sediminibacterium ginsengisoli]|uniref:histidine kinase n=1 Tax=Sediminibacterium ginsengisoli TaxID=413434 RepID=A0A1T4RSH2_9BACT|nr:HAMP domain-containing sensor histidine kinase [Sediminibacterium ginsengisoli]SKA18935.1 Signal transduction histidine kinase [Sediminibacterium ginsengisoli]
MLSPRYLLFLLLFCTVRSYAQQDSLQYHLQHFTAENGLPQNSARSLLYTNEGFLWITTENGLVRFDGIDFKVWNKLNTGITVNRFSIITYDYQRNCYIAVTNNSEMLRISNAEATLLNERYRRDTFPGTPGKRLSYHNPLPAVAAAGKRGPEIPPFYIAAGAATYFVVEHDRVLLLNNNKTEWQQPFAQQVTRMGESNARRFFVLHNQFYNIDNNCEITLYSAAGKQKVAITGDLLNNKAYGHSLQAPALFWMNGQKEILIYLNKCWYRLTASKDNSMHTQLVLSGFDAALENICSATYDPTKQMLFLGSLTNGLYLFTRQYFKSHIVKKAGYPVSTYAIIDYNNTLLSSSGYQFFRDGSYRLLPELIKKSDTYSICTDRSGNVYSKLFEDSTVYRFRNIEQPPVRSWKMPSKVTGLHMDTAANRLWIGGNVGIYYIPLVNDARIVTVNHSLKGISAILPENSNTVWVGTGTGCYRLNVQSGRTDTLHALANTYVRSFSMFRQGEIWITTYEDGFYLYKNGQLTKFPLDQNRYLATCHKILLDRQGFLWMSTNNGLFKASYKELQQYAANKNATPYYAQYTIQDGFATNEFNGGGDPAAIKLNNGDFAFSALNGITVFNPLQVNNESLQKNIYLSSLAIDDKPLPISDTIVLSNNMNRLRIGISVPFIDNPNNINLEYNIGSDSKEGQWLRVENKTITFTRIASGFYKLVIREKNNFSYNTYLYKTLYIDIPPLFYERPLFQTAILLLAALLIYLFIRLRTQRLRRKNERLDRLVKARTQELNMSVHALQESEASLRKGMHLQEKLIASISHDIRTPLKFLLMATERSLRTKENKGQISMEEARIIYQTSDRLYHFTEKMLQYIKTNIEAGKLKASRFSVHELVEQKIRVFAAVAQARDIALINKVPPSLYIHDKEELLGTVIQNLLDNAVKFTGTGSVTIDCRIEGTALIISVTDTGNGIPEWQVAGYNRHFSSAASEQIITGNLSEDLRKLNGLGFAIIKEILPLLSASLEISSQPGKGSTIKLTLQHAVISADDDQPAGVQ